MRTNHETKSNAKGPWVHRVFIRLLTALLTLLIFWVLGFLVDDIRSIPGPEFTTIEEKHLDPSLIVEKVELEDGIRELNRQIDNQSERQRVVGDSSKNLQQTIHQLLELQKLRIQNNVELTESEQTNFSGSLDLFMENQARYQELSQRIAELLAEKQALTFEKDRTEAEIEMQRRPAREEFESLVERHRLKLAFFQLAILLPILAGAAILVIRKRGSIYFPLFLAFGIASLLKVSLVVHAYFPTRYFKYILIGGLLIAVARILIHLIRGIAFPKTQWLIKQYREAYERFLCPVCEYPIRVGPRRFVFWTRRTVHKLPVPADRTHHEEAYTCPSCGTQLFEECDSCHGIRHSMLPSCTHCGAEKVVES